MSLFSSIIPTYITTSPSDQGTRLTSSEDKINNILVHEVGAETDAITSLRSPTHFGRPNVRPCHSFFQRANVQWDRVFESVADKHPDTDCGVFFCGPSGLGETLKGMCGKYTSPMGCRFYFGKEVSHRT
jgi:hypothetical protein